MRIIASRTLLNISFNAPGLGKISKFSQTLPTYMNPWVCAQKFLFSTIGNSSKNFVQCHKLTSYIKCDKTIQILRKKGVHQLFPVQANSYQSIISGCDIIASDRTGSGKTIAFTLPIIQRLRANGLLQKKKFVGIRYVILAPTRELAQQISSQILNIAHYQNQIRIATLIGGADSREQAFALRKKPHIIVATPGRLMDFYQRGSLAFNDVEAVCIDEADLMLQKGFKNDIQTILDCIISQAKQYPQHLFFSATMPRWVVDLTKKFMKKEKKYLNMIGSQDSKASKTVSHMLVATQPSQKINAIKHAIREYSQGGSVLIFTQRKIDADMLTDDLKDIGIRNCVMHGDISQNIRNNRLADFRSGKTKVMIATDVASRGLDIPNVQLVIQYSPPNNTDAYIHRSGRTGRAGKSGICITFANSFQNSDKIALQKIVQESNIEIKSFKAISQSNQTKLEQDNDFFSYINRRSSNDGHFRRYSESQNRYQNRNQRYQQRTPRIYQNRDQGRNFLSQNRNQKKINPLALKIELTKQFSYIDINQLKKTIADEAKVNPSRINKHINKYGQTMIFMNFQTPEMCERLKQIAQIKVIGKNQSQNPIQELSQIKNVYIFSDKNEKKEYVKKKSEENKFQIEEDQFDY